MRKLFFIFICFVVVPVVMYVGSGWLGEKSHITFIFDGSIVRINLYMAILSLVVSYLLIHIVVVLIKQFFGVVSSTKQWSYIRKQNQSFQMLQRSLHAYFEKNYALAEQLSLKKQVAGKDKAKAAADLTKTQYLIAAESAKQQGHFDDHSRYLLRANENGSEFEKQLAMADSLKAQGRLDKALEHTKGLLKKDAKHPQALALLAALYQQIKDNQALAELLPKVYKHCSLPVAVLEDLVESAYCPLYKHYAHEKDVKSIKATHKALVKLSPNLGKFDCYYVNALIEAGNGDDAEKFLLKSAKFALSDELLETLKKSSLNEPRLLITWLEKEIKKQPDNYRLLATLGYVASATRDWSLCCKAFESAMKLETRADDYYCLGSALEHLKKSDQALACYRKGLSLTVS